MTSPAVSRLAGLSAGLPHSFPSQLQWLLTVRYSSQTFEVANEGRPGEAAVDGIRRLRTLLTESAPEVVILLHGVNDVTFLGIDGVPHVAELVNTMARDARLGGADVVIATYPPQRPEGFRAAAPGIVAAFNTLLRDVARGEEATLVDFEREIDLRFIGVDGLHPTEEGHARMSDVLLAVLRARFEVSAP